MKLAVTVVAVALSIPAPAHSQECPVVNGFATTISTGNSMEMPPGTRRDSALFRVDARTVIDTVWRLNIAERRWTRQFLAASVGAGWSGQRSGTGTTTARDTSAARTWSACASAAIGMRDPTLVVRGVRGLVRLRADVSPLSRLGLPRPDSSQQRR
jgi:hypothetical protein